MGLLVIYSLFVTFYAVGMTIEYAKVTGYNRGYDDAKKDMYDEYGMQLSAYAQGCGFVDKAERVSIFVDRQEVGYISCYKWEDDTHSKHRDMFNSLLSYWKLVKNYDPSRQA